MKVQSKPDYLIFADGAKTDELSPFPNVSRGWGVTIDQTNSKPPIEWMNGAFNRVDSNTLYLIQQGVPEWDKSISYPVNAVTKYNGVLYTAIIANDNATPSTSTTKWKKAIADVQDASATQKGVVQLSSATDSDSETQAATSKAVKEAYDKADTANDTANDALSKTETALQTVAGKVNFVGGLQSGSVDVLKVGDGGLWSTTLPQLTDFKLLTNKTGIYRALGAGTPTPTLNAPPTSGNVRLTVCVRSDGLVSHFIVVENRADNPKLWIGQYYSGSDGVKWVEAITTANIASHAVGLGINQTWQDMKASRTFGTTYTNTTTSPIMVNIAMNNDATVCNLTVYVKDVKGTGNEVIVGMSNTSSNWNNLTVISFPVPIGAEYRTVITNLAKVIAIWSELR